MLRDSSILPANSPRYRGEAWLSIGVGDRLETSVFTRPRKRDSSISALLAAIRMTPGPVAATTGHTWTSWLPSVSIRPWRLEGTATPAAIPSPLHLLPALPP